VRPGRRRTRQFGEAICHDPYTYRWCCRMVSPNNAALRDCTGT